MCKGLGGKRDKKKKRGEETLPHHSSLPNLCMPPKLSTVWMTLQCIIFCILSGLPVRSAEAIPKLLYNWINPVMSDWNSSGHTHV